MKSISESGRIHTANTLVALRLFIVAMSVLFLSLASLVVYAWPEKAAQNLPAGWLGLNTLALAVSSGLLVGACRCRRERQRQLVTLLVGVAFALGGGFLVSQSLAFGQAVYQGFGQLHVGVQLLYLVIFLHGVHLLGGFIALVVTLVGLRSARCPLEDDRTLRLTALYWHALGVIWLAFALIVWLGG